MRNIEVDIDEMTAADAEKTIEELTWQTSCASEYIRKSQTEQYFVKHGDELVALGEYQELGNAMYVQIVYMEAQPEFPPRRWTKEIRSIVGLIVC